MTVSDFRKLALEKHIDFSSGYFIIFHTRKKYAVTEIEWSQFNQNYNYRLKVFLRFDTEWTKDGWGKPPKHVIHLLQDLKLLEDSIHELEAVKNITLGINNVYIKLHLTDRLIKDIGIRKGDLVLK